MDDLDALFIDQRQPAQPLPVGLYQRIDEMQRNGCCDKFAWCSNGSLLYLSDQNKLELSLLRFDEAEGKWIQDNYTPTQLQEHVQKVFSTKPVAHISWNPNGVELVVTDVCGRIIICAPFVNANKIMTQKAYQGSENEANRFVGMHWLQPVPPKKSGAESKGEKVLYFPAATKRGNRWAVGPPEQLPVLGPANPWGKSGFITISASGKLQLCYCTPDMNWFQEEQEFMKPEEPGALLTHAAFCSWRENEAVMATLDSSKNARLVVVRVNWTQQPGQQREHPKLEVENLICFRVLFPCFTGPAAAAAAPASISGPLIGGSLSFMRLLYDRTSSPDEHVLPTLLLGFHSLPTTASSAFAAAAGAVNEEEASTTIVQYDLNNGAPVLDENFAKLTTKRSAKQQQQQSAPKTQVKLTPREDVRLEGIVLDVREQSFGKVLALAYSDGKIEFRDRELKIVPLEASTDKVSSLQQIGFSFNAGEACVYNAFSSHACVRATRAKGEKPKLSVIQVSVPLMEVADTAFFDKASAAFVLEHIGKGSHGDFVDVLAAIRAFLEQLTPERALSWKTSFLRSFAWAASLPMKMHESGPEIMNFSSIMQRFLSVQDALGHGSSDASAVGDGSPRTQSSHLAWALQNLRQQMSATIWLVLRPVRPGEQPAWTRAESTAVLGHYAAWSGKLAEWVVSQILAANRLLNYPRTPQDLSFPPNQINDHIPASARIAGALILLPVGRIAFRHILTGIRTMQSKLESIPAHELPEHWAPLERAVRERTLSSAEFGKFLDSCDGICNRLFANGGNPDNKEQAEAQREGARRTIETESLIRGQCEAQLAMPLAMLITRGAWNLRGSCKEGDLAFGDFSVLDPLPTEHGVRVGRGRDVVWDGNRKFELGRRGVEGRGGGEMSHFSSSFFGNSAAAEKRRVSGDDAAGGGGGTGTGTGKPTTTNGASGAGGVNGSNTNGSNTNGKSNNNSNDNKPAGPSHTDAVDTKDADGDTLMDPLHASHPSQPSHSFATDPDDPFDMDLLSDLDPSEDGIRLSTRFLSTGKPIPPLRTCTRCANVMEDQASQRTRQSDLFGSFLRQCFCGGSWVEVL